MKNHKPYQPKQDFIRVAAASPVVSIANVARNVSEIKKISKTAAEKNVSLIVFPELSLTGYSIQDLVRQTSLLSDAIEGLIDIANFSKSLKLAMIVGLPLTVGNGIYNCAAFISDGEIKGIVPKQHLPNYDEFYEKRWYQTWINRPNILMGINDRQVPFGIDQLFEIDGNLVGIEICEDLWVPQQPSIKLVENGATIIANPSASTETVTKEEYRRDLVSMTAARLTTSYVYASASPTESTSETVMSGHCMINEMGIMLAESKPFAAEEIIIADIDTSHITHDRIKTTNFPNESIIAPTKTAIKKRQTNLIRIIGPAPFVPSNETTKSERLNSILQIQSTGLAMRLRQTGINKVVLGLSGGLDSTLALMVAIKSARILGLKPLELIHTLTMPGDASSDRTQNNAAKLAESLNIVNEEIPISKLSKKQLEAIGHTDKQDITYENTQARIRQALVFNKANQIHGLALGTGDMSEIALGWCTYNGDHMSHYNVNTSIPKTLVRSLVDFASLNLNPKARKIVLDIIDTPISPELLGNQKTEDIIGPYELHDFFLYHFVRWMEPIEKIRYLAKTAFKNSYADQQIDKWLNVFVDRFYKNQWKRQAMPDGAKVGISLSPKGDWRMPPEASLPKLDFNSKLNV